MLGQAVPAHEPLVEIHDPSRPLVRGYVPERELPRVHSGQDVRVRVTNREGDPVEFLTTCRIDTPVEIEYYRNGGILHTVLRNMLKGSR